MHHLLFELHTGQEGAGGGSCSLKSLLALFARNSVKPSFAVSFHWLKWNRCSLQCLCDWKYTPQCFLYSRSWATFWLPSCFDLAIFSWTWERLMENARPQISFPGDFHCSFVVAWPNGDFVIFFVKSTHKVIVKIFKAETKFRRWNEAHETLFNSTKMAHAWEGNEYKLSVFICGKIWIDFNLVITGFTWGSEWKLIVQRLLVSESLRSILNTSH